MYEFVLLVQIISKKDGLWKTDGVSGWDDELLGEKLWGSSFNCVISGTF